MWRLALGTVLSPLPRRWRVALQPGKGLPWVSATVLSGLLESLLVYWYYLSVNVGGERHGFRAAKWAGERGSGTGDRIFRVGIVADASMQLADGFLRN